MTYTTVAPTSAISSRSFILLYFGIAVQTERISNTNVTASRYTAAIGAENLITSFLSLIGSLLPGF